MTEMDGSDEFDNIINGNEGLKEEFTKIDAETTKRQLFKKLEQEQLGRTIYLDSLTQNEPDQLEPLPDAYILPSNEAESEHLILCRDGRMLAVSTPEGKPIAEDYTNTFSTTRTPKHYLPPIVTTIPELSHHYDSLGWLRADSNSANQYPEFGRLITRSVNISCNMAGKGSKLRSDLNVDLQSTFYTQKSQPGT